MKPKLVAQISLSNAMNMDGRTKITTSILISAPLAIKLHKELIISMFEYRPTPKVAAKNPKALTKTDWMDLDKASVTASLFSIPLYLFFLYLFVIRIA